ncbi:carbohydrate ABC transporter permease [Acidipropionibacterium jensenii]|uniref:carbohydrate ABC transporter permease n=1 Tax=Acidipropionibacterium jensenii TaxID=1749 RepID=UPI00214B12AB|nr:sugar ABC transporter permease [Acidipropionibacterium jensenii]
MPKPRPLGKRPFTRHTVLTIAGFLLPAFVFVVIFTYYPMIRGSQMAFRQWNLFDLTNTPWIGLGNFRTIVSDPIFARTIGNTAVWVVGSLVPQVVIGFLIALALRKGFRFRGIYQALVFYPWAVSGFLIGILFRWMFNSEFGVVNDLLTKAHIISDPVPWLADANLAMTAVIIANIWYGVTFFAMMILAALQSIPEDILEAAALDGAGRIRTLFLIMIPYVRSTLTLTILLRIIWIFNFPDIIYAMTGGGPANQTHITATWMIQFTQQGSYGLASALGLIIVMVLFIFTAIYLRVLTKEDD